MTNEEKKYKSPRDLPLYTAVYKLLKLVDQMVYTFNRDRKHTLGQAIYRTVLEMFEPLRIAYDFPEQREGALVTLLGKFDMVQTMLKLCNEREYIRRDIYLEMARPLASIERQANGWLISTRIAGVSDMGIAESASI